MHCGGRDGGAGAMGLPPDEGGAGGSSARHVGPGGRPRRMSVHDSAMGVIGHGILAGTYLAEYRDSLK